MIKDLAACFSLALGPVHRDLGIAYQVLRITVRSCAKSDSNAGRRHHFLPVHDKRNTQPFLNALGYANSITTVSNALQQNGEFIAAQPRQTPFARYRACALRHNRARNGIDTPNGSSQSAGNLYQKRVSRRMAQAVIEHFEFIEIDKQHSELIADVPLRKHKYVAH